MAIRSLLKLPVVGYANETAFLKDIDDMVALAKKQPGYLSCQIWRSLDRDGQPVYLVESEWETREAMSAMEHHADHEAVMDRYPDKEPVHLRVVPWVRGVS